MQKALLYTLLVLLVVIHCEAQYKYTPIFPALKSEALFSKLKENYTPNRVIEYNTARDTLFLKIDAIDRKLSCIYTNLTLPIPEGTDPTVAVFLNGANNGINTEHVYPLSLGTENTNAQSDMHHLYPSKIKTNADRGNLPYGESLDNLTTKWYKDKDELGSKPTTNIEDYSELGIGLFEPKEDSKGDIARSIFYVYTIYRDEVTAVNQDFFNIQKATLCNWHNLDLVDEKEWKRTEGIAKYQGNVNPFVLDCTLASRMYCDNFSSSCGLLSSKETHLNNIFIFNLENQVLSIVKEGKYTLSVFDIMGREIKTMKIENNISEENNINLAFLSNGFYSIVLFNNSERYYKKIIIP
jgi:hypothetical protein